MHAVRVAIGPARVRGWHRKRVVAEPGRSVAEHQPELGGLERRKRIRFAAVRLKGVAGGTLDALDVPRRAGDAEQILEQRVVRLEVFVLQAPVLDRQRCH